MVIMFLGSVPPVRRPKTPTIATLIPDGGGTAITVEAVPPEQVAAHAKDADEYGAQNISKPDLDIIRCFLNQYFILSPSIPASVPFQT